MRTSKAQIVPATEHDMPATTIGQRLRMVAARRAEEILAEVAPTLRRLRTLLLVLTVCIPVFLAGLVVVLWHFAH